MNSHSYKHQAWNALKRRWKIPIFATIIYVWIHTLIFGINMAMRVFNITWLFTGLINIAYAYVMCDVIRLKPLKLYNAFTTFRRHNVNAFMVGILTYMFQLLWSILLIVPGIIKTYEYSMVYYVALDKPTISPLDIIHESSIMMKGKKWELFKLDISFFGWYLLSFLTGGILLFMVIPYHQAARAAFYEDIRYKPYVTC